MVSVNRQAAYKMLIDRGGDTHALLCALDDLIAAGQAAGRRESALREQIRTVRDEVQDECSRRLGHLMSPRGNYGECVVCGFTINDDRRSDRT